MTWDWTRCYFPILIQTVEKQWWCCGVCMQPRHWWISEMKSCAVFTKLAQFITLQVWSPVTGGKQVLVQKHKICLCSLHICFIHLYTYKKIVLGITWYVLNWNRLLDMVFLLLKPSVCVPARVCVFRYSRSHWKTWAQERCLFSLAVR